MSGKRGRGEQEEKHEGGDGGPKVGRSRKKIEHETWPAKYTMARDAKAFISMYGEEREVIPLKELVGGGAHEDERKRKNPVKEKSSKEGKIDSTKKSPSAPFP